MNIQDFEIFKTYKYKEFKNNGKTWNLSSEPYLSIVLTDCCNSNCSFCIGDLVHTKSNLNYDTMKQKVEFAVNNMGVKDVLLLGGEPTISPMLIPTIQHLKTLNLEKIIVTTNGLEFSKKNDFLRSACLAGLTNINLSYMNDDYQLQRLYTVGAYADESKKSLALSDVMNIYSTCKELGVKLRINTNVFVENHASLDDAIDFYNAVCNYCDSIKFSPLLKVDNFSVVPIKTKWVEDNILSDRHYDRLFKLIEETFCYRNNVSVITNDNQFGFVKNTLIPLKTPIILNYNHRGRMLNQVLNFNQINNIKLLPIGELSLSWNRESTEFFIDTTEVMA